LEPDPIETRAIEGRMSELPERRRGWSWWYLLLLVQFVAVLWPPFYNRAEPYWIGMPFFYWYQLLWVIIGAALTAIVYLATEKQG
jgi:hypothetical protein